MGAYSPGKLVSAVIFQSETEHASRVRPACSEMYRRRVMVGISRAAASRIAACDGCAVEASRHPEESRRAIGKEELRLSRLTVAKPVNIEGSGLHLGESCRLTFQAAPPGQGIVFLRTDIPNAAPIPALVDQVSASERQTQLGTEPNAVHTVEHVLAAVSAHNID